MHSAIISSPNYAQPNYSNISNIPTSPQRDKFQRGIKKERAIKEVSEEKLLNNEPKEEKINLAKRKIIEVSGTDDLQPSFFKTPKNNNTSFSEPDSYLLAVPKLNNNFFSTYDNNNSQTFEKAPAKNCPPTPAKRRPGTKVSDYAILLKSVLDFKSILIGNQEVNLTHLADGSYLKVFNVEARNPVVEGVENDALVIKLFNEKMVPKSEKELSSYMECSVKNYFLALNNGIKVSQIYNAKTADKGKYYIQEKIPQQFDLNDAFQVEQLKEIFLLGLQRKELILDLIPGNLLVADNGDVVLIDFVEDEGRGKMCFIQTAMFEWCKKGRNELNWTKKQALEFLLDFTRGFEKYGYSNNESILNQLYS